MLKLPDIRIGVLIGMGAIKKKTPSKGGGGALIGRKAVNRIVTVRSTASL